MAENSRSRAAIGCAFFVGGVGAFSLALCFYFLGDDVLRAIFWLLMAAVLIKAGKSYGEGVTKSGSN